MEFNCDKCNFHSNNKSHYTRHNKAPKHLKNMNEIPRTRYNCDKCNIHTSRRNEWIRHCKTKKHENKEENHPKLYECLACNTFLRTISSLSDHIILSAHLDNVRNKYPQAVKDSCFYTKPLDFKKMGIYIKKFESDDQNICLKDLNVHDIKKYAKIKKKDT